MLPPIPQGLVPVTVQQDVVKPRPDIPPVTPSQPGAEESSVALEQRNSHQAEALREEQKRRQRQGYSPAELAEGEVAEEDQKNLEDLPRQGLWIDIEV